MPHHKSAAKRVITNEKSRQRNIALRDLVVPTRAFPHDTLNIGGYLQANGYAGQEDGGDEEDEKELLRSDDPMIG